MKMTEEEVKDLLVKTNAIMNGHFLLTSGLHSPHYVEKFNVLQHPKYTQQLCEAMAEKFKDADIETVVGPMTGGILLASILVKLYMYLYNRAVGKKIGSAAMEATAMDSLSDCAATAAVLAATLIGRFTSLQIDGWCGIVVAALVLWAGIQAARDTISPLLGQPPAPEFVQRIEEIVLSSPVVQGIHDLIVHDYGPGRVMISLHAEVPAHGDIMALHDEIDNIEQRLRRELGCAATIHMDPIVTDDKLTAETRERVAQLVRGIDEHITIHDFRMVTGPTHTNVIFDAVVPFKFRLSDHEVEQEIQAAVKRLDSSYFAVVQIDRDYTK